MRVFGDSDRIFEFSRYRIAYAVLSAAAFLLTEFGRLVYRPYKYRAGFDDFGIADTVGNSLGVITQIFLLLAFMHSSRRQGLHVIAFVTCGYIVYEFLQPILPRGTFDMKDILAAIIGAVAAVGLLWLTHRLAGDSIVIDSAGDPPPSE